MNYKNDEINEQTIPPCYSNRVHYNANQRNVVRYQRREQKERFRLILDRRQKRELILWVVGAVIAGLLFAHMGYILVFIFTGLGMI